MGLRLNRAVEPEWIKHHVDLTFTGGSPMGNVGAGGSLVWKPPDGEIHIVRGVVAYADDADPLVAGGGATTVRLGGSGGINTAQFINATALATWNTSSRILGWGSDTPTTLTWPTGVVIVGSNLSEKPTSDKSIVVSCDVGSVTGTMHFIFESKRIL